MADWGLLIGRFQPFHRGHEAMARQALAQVDRLLFILGSTEQARDIRNPFTFAERVELIRAALPDVPAERLHFAGVPDVLYCEEEWLRRVREAVAEHVGEQVLTLFGHRKDSSSYYLALFPEWRYQELPNFEGISATPLREALLAAGDSAPECLADELADAFPAAMRETLSARLRSPDFAEQAADFAAIAKSKQAWSASPYPPTFVTADALVECEDQILLIQRGGRPGQGLLAMPGGFLDPEERLRQAAERELLEETGLDLAEHAHQFLGTAAYDAPDRSCRGRFVTHLFHYRIDGPRPDVSAGDDAGSADWYALDGLDPTRFFEDHYCIIAHALRRYPAQHGV